ncbi:MAG: hypothetical protein M3R72_11325 [Bacteroidota bacterium]|nr:hypothetical protein [Bacteroidota bacterium]
MTKEKLANNILANITDRKKFARKDSMTSETLLLLAVLSSFSTAILAVNDNVDKFIIAILGGFSGIIVIIYQRFSYAKKSTWNELYRIDLQRLLNELEIAEPFMALEKYTALQEKKKKEWATKNFEF